MDANVAELLAKIEALEAKVASLEDRHPPAQPDDAPVSRRHLLAKVGAAAAGGGALAATGLVGGGRAVAATGDFLKLGVTNSATSTTELQSNGGIYVNNADSSPVSQAIWGVSPNGGRGVRGVGYVGVLGAGDEGGIGVRGDVPDSGHGVLGRAGVGFGVKGEATTASGVGVGGVGADGGIAVRGEVPNYGYAVRGRAGAGFGVHGEASGAGTGVHGQSATGFGVSGSSTKAVAVSGQGRIGGEFKGTRAAIRLVPADIVGAPTTSSHRRGELMCDKNGQLWFCTTDGTPGTWVTIA